MTTASLAGSPASFMLPDVFTFIAAAHKTGMLTLSSGEREAYVFFRGGGIVYAASNQDALRLGAILLRKRKISREQSAAVDDAVLRGGGRYGEVAVQQGVLPQEQIDDYLKVQVAEVIYDAFVWRDVDDAALHVYRVVYGLFANKLIEPLRGAPPPPAQADETMRQAAANFGGDSTVVELSDDTSLLVSSEARLSYADVVKKTIAQLSVTAGEGEGKIFPLSEAEHHLGRLFDNDILLSDPGVSGHHARIYRGPEGYAIEGSVILSREDGEGSPDAHTEILRRLRGSE